MRSPTPRIAALGAAALLLAGVLPGQWGYFQRQRSSAEASRQQNWAPPPQWASPMAPQSQVTSVPPPYRPGFQGMVSTTPMYTAFPSYPTGYGPPPRTGGRILASPKARRLAKERGIDLNSITRLGVPEPNAGAGLSLPGLSRSRAACRDTSSPD